MDRELAVKYIIMSKETKAQYNRPLFTKYDIDRLLTHFETTDIYFTTCNSLQKTSCFIDESRYMIFDTGITEFFAFLNEYVEHESNTELLDGILLRLFAEGFYLADEFDFAALLLKGYEFYDEKLIRGLKASSYRYLKIQEIFMAAHELAHAKLGDDGFNTSYVYEKEREALAAFRDVAKNRIKVPSSWIEYYDEHIDERSFYEEFICDSMAVRAVFSVLELDIDTVYTISNALISAIFIQYIVASINSDVIYAKGCMDYINRHKDDTGNVKLMYPSDLHNFGSYLVYRYGYIRFCINTICQDFGISYEDMKTVDNHMFEIGEHFQKLFQPKYDGTKKILELFYDYKSSGGFTVDIKKSRHDVKQIIINQARKFDAWINSMSK